MVQQYDHCAPAKSVAAPSSFEQAKARCINLLFHSAGVCCMRFRLCSWVILWSRWVHSALFCFQAFCKSCFEICSVPEEGKQFSPLRAWYELEMFEEFATCMLQSSRMINLHCYTTDTAPLACLRGQHSQLHLFALLITVHSGKLA